MSQIQDHEDRLQERRLLLRQLGQNLGGTPPAAAARSVPRWALASGSLLLLAAAGLALQAWRDSAPALVPAAVAAAPLAAPTAPSASATVAAPLGGDIKLEVSGTISAARVATVSPRTMGQLVETLSDEGARVQRGQLLARLDDRQARIDFALGQAQLGAAAATVHSAEAALREVQRSLQREQGLFEQQFSSAARLSSAQAAVETAQAALGGARAAQQVAALQVQRLQQALEDLLVRAPFDGVVQARNAQTGEFVAPGSAGGGYTRTGVFTIVDMDSLEIVVDVNEQHIHKVHPGQRVAAELYSQRLRLEGQVLRIMPSADRAKATVRVRIRLDTRDPQILPDMAVKVAFL